MRFIRCGVCKTLSRVDDFDGTNPDDDRLLVDWIQRHMHGLTVETHPGSMIFPVDEPQLAISPDLVLLTEREREMDRDLFERAAVEQIKAVLEQQQIEVFGEVRDELKEDAAVCFRRHGNPSFPDKPCIDYHADSKRLGGRGPSDNLKYLCTYCPYESTVTVAKRAQRGDYR